MGDVKKNGVFNNGIRYIKVGSGSKVIFLLLGGPGDMFTDSRGDYIPDVFSELLNERYSVYVLSRKRNIPKDYSMYDIAKDVVEVIDEHFSGCIDILIGASFGGFLAYQIAANFGDKVNYYITLGAPYTIPEEALKIDDKMVEYVAKKEYKEAFSSFAEVLYSDPLMIKQFNELVEKDSLYVFNRLFNSDYDNFIEDMKIENKACHGVNYEELLKKIDSKVLLIGGTKDKYFTNDLLEKTRTLIKGSKLVMLEGKAHGELLTVGSINHIEEFVK